MCSLTHDKRKKVGQTIFIRQKGAKNGRIEQTFTLFFNKIQMSNIPRFFQSEGMALHNTITYSLLKRQEYFYCHVVQTFLTSETNNQTEYKRYNTVIGNKTIQFFPYNIVKIHFNSDTILTCICSLYTVFCTVPSHNTRHWWSSNVH